MFNNAELNFDSLPDEIKLLIFSFFTTAELNNLIFVNKN